MADLAWRQTIVSGGAGGALTLGGQWLLASRQLRHQEEERQAQLLESTTARRDAFEIEHLVALRDHLTVVFQAILRPERGPQFAADLAKLRAEMGLALDDDVRATAELAYSALAEFTWATDAGGEGALGSGGKAGHAVTDAQGLVADRIRTLYGRRSS